MLHIDKSKEMKWRYILPFGTVFLILMVTIIAVALFRPSFPTASEASAADTQTDEIEANQYPYTMVSIETPAEVAESKTFTATVRLTNVTDFDACNFDFSYNESVLAVKAVTDALGDSNTETKTDYLTIYPSLAVDFSIGSSDSPEGTAVFIFSGTTSGGKPDFTYAWDFNNDGLANSTTLDTTYTYGAVGTYHIALTVTDTLGNSSTRIKILLLYAVSGTGEESTITAPDITQLEQTLYGPDSPVQGVDPEDVELIYRQLLTVST